MGIKHLDLLSTESSVDQKFSYNNDRCNHSERICKIYSNNPLKDTASPTNWVNNKFGP